MGGRSKILLLVSPICEGSLRVARELRKWAESKGVELEELSVLTKEGQEVAMSFKVDMVPAVIVGDRLVAQGGMPDLKQLESVLSES